MQRNDEAMRDRVREVLDKLYDREPPQFRDYLRRFREDPKSRVFAPLAEAYRRQGRYDDAIAVCRQGLTHHPDYSAGRVTLARCFLDKKQFDEARQELEAVVQTSPENLLAQRLLGEAHLGLGDKRSALHALRMALMMAPQDVTLDEKIRALELSLSEPDEPGLSLEDLTLPDSMQEGDRLIGSFSETLIESVAPMGVTAPMPEADESITESSFSLDALLEAGRGDDAEIPDGQETFHIQHVSSIFREEADDSAKEITTVTLGNLYYQQGQYERALRIFEKVAEGKPSAEILQKVHVCRLRLGVDEDALRRARKIEQLRGLLRKVRTGNA